MARKRGKRSKAGKRRVSQAVGASGAGAADNKADAKVSRSSAKSDTRVGNPGLRAGRPTVIGARSSGWGAGRLQERVARHDGWTETRRTKFLSHLARTANVRASAEIAGFPETTAYRLRRRCAEFAALWDAALDEGYRCLEEQLLARALAGTADAEPDGDVDPRVIAQSNALALQLLRQHRERVARIRANRDGGRDPAKVFDELTERLRLIYDAQRRR